VQAHSGRSQPGLVWRITRRMNPSMVKIFSRPDFRGPDVLLLTTIGRKSGLPRVTPLQFEEWEGAYCVGSGRGSRADWLLNLRKTPRVDVEIRGERFAASAEPIDDPAKAADFLEHWLKKHPFMVRAMLVAHGVPFFPKRQHLETLAKELVFVELRRG
jgi:deazaflavin-dependent oxidoreductase (nitroreductase family)